MATKNIQNRLITPELEEALKGYPLYSQDGKKKDATCIVVFSLGNVRWYIMEGQREGDDFTFYGIVAGLQETEYGYASANEMASIAYDASEYGLGTLRFEQDKQLISTAMMMALMPLRILDWLMNLVCNLMAAVIETVLSIILSWLAIILTILLLIGTFLWIVSL